MLPRLSSSLGRVLTVLASFYIRGRDGYRIGDWIRVMSYRSDVYSRIPRLPS